MKIINKKDLSSLVYTRLNKAIPKRLIYDIIGIIADDMSDKLSENKSISIDNFGTISTYILPGHNAMNIATNTIDYIEPRRNIRFIAHSTLDALIQNRIKKFTGS